MSEDALLEHMVSHTRLEDHIGNCQGKVNMLESMVQIKFLEMWKRVLDIDPQIQSLKTSMDSLILIVAELEERIFKLESRAAKANLHE